MSSSYASGGQSQGLGLSQGQGLGQGQGLSQGQGLDQERGPVPAETWALTLLAR